MPHIVLLNHTKAQTNLAKCCPRSFLYLYYFFFWMSNIPMPERGEILKHHIACQLRCKWNWKICWHDFCVSTIWLIITNCIQSATPIWWQHSFLSSLHKNSHFTFDTLFNVQCSSLIVRKCLVSEHANMLVLCISEDWIWNRIDSLQWVHNWEVLLILRLFT